MSAWPWMKGVKVTIADPIPPVSPTDNRPSVKDLIEENRQNIYYVGRALKKHPLYNSRKHDALWIVRFLLSHGKDPKLATKAAMTTLAFRNKYKLDERDIRGFPVTKTTAQSAALRRFFQYCSDDAFRFTIFEPKNRGVVGFLNMAGFDQHALVANVAETDWVPTFCYASEWTHQWVDYVTRTTGRLTKSVRLADLAEMKINGISKEMAARDGRAMGVMEDCYPQLLEKIFICNPPTWIQTPWRAIRPLMPNRVIAKVDFVTPGKNKKELDRILQYMTVENLPTRFGGKNTEWPISAPVTSEA